MENEFRNVYITVALILSVLLVRRYITRRGVLLPPGPKGLPVIGNVLQVPKDFAWLQFAKWGEEFGSCSYSDLEKKPPKLTFVKVILSTSLSSLSPS